MQATTLQQLHVFNKSSAGGEDGEWSSTMSGSAKSALFVFRKHGADEDYTY